MYNDWLIAALVFNLLTMIGGGVWICLYIRKLKREKPQITLGESKEILPPLVISERDVTKFPCKCDSGACNQLAPYKFSRKGKRPMNRCAVCAMLEPETNKLVQEHLHKMVQAGTVSN